jgi:hypothetical protein
MQLVQLLLNSGEFSAREGNELLKHREFPVSVRD